MQTTKSTGPALARGSRCGRTRWRIRSLEKIEAEREPRTRTWTWKCHLSHRITRNIIWPEIKSGCNTDGIRLNHRKTQCMKVNCMQQQHMLPLPSIISACTFGLCGAPSPWLIARRIFAGTGEQHMWRFTGEQEDICWHRWAPSPWLNGMKVCSTNGTSSCAGSSTAWLLTALQVCLALAFSSLHSNFSSINTLDWSQGYEPKHTLI